MNLISQLLLLTRNIWQGIYCHRCGGQNVKEGRCLKCDQYVE